VAPDAIVIVDQRERIVYVNAATERLFGFSADELHGESVEVVLSVRFQVTPRAQTNEYQKAPRSRLIGEGREFVGRHKAGTEIPVEISRSTVTTDQGTWVMSVIKDLRERRMVPAERDHLLTEVAPVREDVRAETRNAGPVPGELRALAETIPAGVIVADARG